MSAAPTPPARARRRPDDSWTVKRPRSRRRGAAAREAAPRRAADLRRLLDLRLRRREHRLADRDHRLRLILALKGPAWWHYTGIGHFFNSIHLWAVELFFFVMVVHLWGKYWMAAWRGGRARVWMTGAITFLVAVPRALTGYVSQQNFDAQWIATQAKDGLNSVGVGAFFNVTNFGQMYSYHILLLPVAVVLLVAAHVLLVRRNGVVPPFELQKRDELSPAAAAGTAARRRRRSRRSRVMSALRRMTAPQGRHASRGKAATPRTTSSKSCASRSA